MGLVCEITGELLSVREGRSYEGRSGTVTPGEVVLLVRDETYTVRYPTVAAAQAATGDAPERAPLTLRVIPSIAGTRAARDAAWIEWRGSAA